MGTRKRLLYFILLNIIVSALTTWVVASLVLKNVSPPVEDTTSGVAQAGQDDEDEGAPVQPAAPDNGEDDGQVVPVVVGQLEIDTVIGAGDLETERILVRHVGDEEVSLFGWQLQDEDGNVFNFPALTMFSGGRVNVYTKSGTSTVVELYWGQIEAVWSEGETAYLVDPNGDIQAVFVVP